MFLRYIYLHVRTYLHGCERAAGLRADAAGRSDRRRWELGGREGARHHLVVRDVVPQHQPHQRVERQRPPPCETPTTIQIRIQGLGFRV